MSCCLSQNVLKFTHTYGNKNLKYTVARHSLHFWSQRISNSLMRLLQGEPGWNRCNCGSHRCQIWLTSKGSDYKLSGSSLRENSQALPTTRGASWKVVWHWITFTIATLRMRCAASLSRTAGIFLGCRWLVFVGDSVPLHSHRRGFAWSRLTPTEGILCLILLELSKLGISWPLLLTLRLLLMKMWQQKLVTAM